MKNLITNLILVLAILFVVRLADASTITVTYHVQSKYSKSLGKTATQPSTPKLTKTVAQRLPVVEAVPTDEVEKRVYEATVREFGAEYWEAMKYIVSHESGFNQFAWNSSSGAGGLFQALPYSKTGCELSDLDCQIRWGISYISQRYQNPNNAYQFWISHNWY